MSVITPPIRHAMEQNTGAVLGREPGAALAGAVIGLLLSLAAADTAG